MTRDMDRWKRDILSSPYRLALPVMTHPGIERIGATVRDAVTSGDVHFRAIKTLWEMLPAAATTTIMDLSVEAEAFGAVVTLHDDEVPTITDRVVATREDIQRLSIPDPHKARTKEYLKAAALAGAAITDRPVLAGCIGPFSLAGRLYGMTEIMMDLLDDPSLIHALLEKATAFLMTYLRAFRESGVNGIFIAEPAAGLLSPPQCDEFSSKYVRELVRGTQTSEFAIILHNCGNTGVLNASMQSTGAWGYHLGNSNDIVRSLPEFAPDALVLGNIDPVKFMKLGSPEQVAAEVTCLLERTAEARNFILSTGCDTPPQCPWGNVHAFFAALNDFNAARKGARGTI